MADSYEKPSIIALGSVEDFTRGPGGGIFDSVFGTDDGDGGILPPYNDFS